MIDYYLQKNKSIVIYGAGDVGVKVYNYIISKNSEIDITGFAISESASDNLFGLPVYNVYEIPKLQPCSAVIVASLKYSKEMIKKLIEIGITEFYCISKNDLKRIDGLFAIRRKQKIEQIFGKIGGCYYRFWCWIHKNSYCHLIAKRKIKFKIQKKDLYLRIFSRDFDFFESIFVGEYNSIQKVFVGEYDYNKTLDIDGFFDLGANIGLFSILYALKFPQKTIVALEPETSNYEMLCLNTKGFKNIIPINAGIWFRDAFCEVCSGRVVDEKTKTVSEGSFYIQECGEKADGAMKSFSLKTLFDVYGFERALIKMDIEGAEKEIFESQDLSWIGNCFMLFVETHEWLIEKDIDSMILNKMKHKGFKNWQQGENKVFLREE